MNLIKNNKILKQMFITQIYRNMSSTEKFLDVEFDKGVKKIIMCHSKTRNSMSINMMDHLIEQISNQKNDPNLRVIVISSTGPIFSAGHNLKELGPNTSKSHHQKVFNMATKLMVEILENPVPIIARVDGLAAAAGCQLVAQCDLAFCTEKSTFSTPGVNFGIFCSTPGIALSRKLQKSTVLQMLFTGQPITSQEAQKSGLVNKVCTQEMIDTEIEKNCEHIKEKSRDVVELGKKFFYKQIQNDIKTAYNLGADVMVENVGLENGQEGIKSFIEKRKPQWKK